MFKNENGTIIDHERVIFPLIFHNVPKEDFRCIGTAFFVNTLGWFITAKHVLYNNQDEVLKTTFGIQTLSDGRQVARPVKQLSIHPFADIALGILSDDAYDGHARPVMHELAPTFELSLSMLSVQDEICSFNFPNSKKTYEKHLVHFNFKGLWTTGKVESYLPDGSPIVKNACYQTSMQINNGASGGPVFKGDQVVAVNSSGFELSGDESPLSFVTPIDFILDLNLEDDNGLLVSMDTLVKQNFIKFR